MRPRSKADRQRQQEKRARAQTPKDTNQPAALEGLPAQKQASIYNVPASKSFIDSVAAGIFQRAGDDPLSIASNLIVVPDDATASALRMAFARVIGEKIGLLPRIETVTRIQAGELGLQLAGDAALTKALADLPPPADNMERQLFLANEILKQQGGRFSLTKAMQLAGELGHFIDLAIRHGVGVAALDDLVPAGFEKQWQKTREFLSIATDAWPAHLAHTNRINAEAHKKKLSEIYADHWQKNPPAHPVLAVGFHATEPATRKLLASIAAAPKGEIILQGFDADIDDASWQALSAIHPQAALRDILLAADIKKEDVAEWPLLIERTGMARAVNPEHVNQARAKLLREALRPAATAGALDKISIDPQALSGMDLIIAGSAQEESSVIALKLRETLEVAGRTAALVTTDRALARRVSARLRHWQIEVPDSAGLPLAETPAGIFLHTTASMAADELAPIPFLEAMKHPLATLGRDKADFASTLTALEDAILHGPRPAEGTKGMRASLKRVFNDKAARRGQTLSKAKNATPTETQQEHDRLQKMVKDLEVAGKEFFALSARKRPIPFTLLLDAHIRFAEALAATADNDGPSQLWRSQDGARAARLLVSLRESAHHMPAMTGRDYADALDHLMRGVSVNAGPSGHPRLKILTPEQALMHKADIIIVGGLNDDSWPRKPADNPWLSPDMLKKLGVPGPTAAIGRDAYLFTQALSAPNVLLTRAARAGDGPGVASPFLTRLMTVVRAAGMDQQLIGKTPLLDIHHALHTPGEVNPIDAPAPTPARHLRPKQLPVTAIERLMRDPYSIYARYVLKLTPKQVIDAGPGVADRGIFTHAALDTFLRRHPERMPENPYEELIKIGREAFKPHLDDPTVQSFWWPRFERVAKWFVQFEAERRDVARTLGTEVGGRLEIDLGDSVFTLTSIADRIDYNQDDQLEIIDYKTGSVPTQKSVALGLSPQLTLEALIAFTGGFNGIDAGDVGKLQYWKLSGGRPAADVITVKGDVKQLVDEAREGVTNLMRAFNDPATPYLVTPRPDDAPRYNSYTHLSRVGEWSTVKKTTAPAANQNSTRKARDPARQKAPRRKAGNASVTPKPRKR